MNFSEIAMEEIGAWVSQGEQNPYECILLNATAGATSWMDRYQLPVLPEERKLAAFLLSYDSNRLLAMGEHIADAFLHGFLSQNRVRAERKIVRLSYQIGQEAIAREVFYAMKRKGLAPSVQKPGCLTRLKPEALILNEAELQYRKNAYKEAFAVHEAALKSTCGMVGLVQFGETPAIPTAPKGTNQQQLFAAQLAGYRRKLESRWIEPSTISFCKIAFPNLFIGDRFEEIFEDVFQLNMVDSEPYERMQQTIIDALDECSIVRVQGCEKNRTDLTVCLKTLSNPEKQSNFLNCGGDLNIPYGEIFTTPVLNGTSGLLHIREVYLAGVPFRDLELEFKDGYIVRVDSKEGTNYVKHQLLAPYETLTAGEFALGTNMRAYAIAKKYGLLPRIPILWLEKMGPHLAVGDPCFARGENASVFNLYDGKEMIARENARTKERTTGKEVYYNKHIDITIPYGDIGVLYGVTKSGRVRMIVQNGRFVLAGAEGLNEGLEEFA